MTVSIPKFLFTITSGRTGCSYLSDLLKENFPSAEIYHQKISYTTMGQDCPDTSHMMQFNSVGNSDHVKQFWELKSQRILENGPNLYAETSHFNARAGLIESIDKFSEHGPVRLLHLYRDKLEVVWSYYNSFEFTNIGFSWLFSLDPNYPNVIIPCREYLKHGTVGHVIWYVDEMNARTTYYQQLIKEQQNISFLSVPLDQLFKESGARRVVEFFTGFSIANKIKLPNKINNTKQRHFSIEKKQEIAQIIGRLNIDHIEAGRNYFALGHRLGHPKETGRHIKFPVQGLKTKKPLFSAKEYATLVNNSLSLGQLKSAIDQLNDALEHYSQCSNFRKSLAQCLYDIGELEQSLRQFDILIEREPEVYEHLTHKAVVLMDIGKGKEALEIGLKASSKFPSAWLSIASIYRKNKDNKSALSALESCIELLPDNFLARNAITMLLFDMGKETSVFHR